MVAISPDIITYGLTGLAAIIALLLGTTLAAIVSLRSAVREQREVHREIFGLLRKIEGLTASRREQVVRQYDKMLENLSLRLPTTVASELGKVMYDTESRILARLAEIEPELSRDGEPRRKLEELVSSMEKLEETIVSATSDTVRQVMLEGRQTLITEVEGSSSFPVT